MRQAGRIAAAVEVLHEVLSRHRPASEVLKDWGRVHRFAGSADRHAIGTLVYDSLRTKLSSALHGGGFSARQIVLGTLSHHWQIETEALVNLAGEDHGPGALSEAEIKSLRAVVRVEDWVAADIPQWLWPQFEGQFGGDAVAQGKALAIRAPIDLRTNTLKAVRAQVIEALSRFGAGKGPLSPWAVRIGAPGPDKKHVSVEAEPAHGLGWFEVQDAASQYAALLTGVKAGERVADICAGAGGKTLALAAMMQNEGELVAYDLDRHRLRPMFERITRAGVTNVKVEEPSGSFDCVVIDAPCSGSGAWRRKPDSKWKLTRKLLDQRMNNQREVLRRGATLVKPGGRLVYITCSVLVEENTKQIAWFLEAVPGYSLIPTAQIRNDAPDSADGRRDSLLLTPHTHGTDGFFVTVMRRN
jgi:16S rRNA (cytosine967-C5)-methyltransferase